MEEFILELLNFAKPFLMVVIVFGFMYVIGKLINN
jgi:hypothetical protein